MCIVTGTSSSLGILRPPQHASSRGRQVCIVFIQHVNRVFARLFHGRIPVCPLTSQTTIGQLDDGGLKGLMASGQIWTLTCDTVVVDRDSFGELN